MTIIKEIDKRKLVEESLTDSDIFIHYFGKFKIGVTYTSPLRQDNNPSFSPYITKSQRVKFKDFATGEIFSGIEFVQALYKLSYNEALTKICQDFSLSQDRINTSKIIKENKTKIIESKKSKIIQIIPKNFSFEDLVFFNSFGINKMSTLRDYNIYSIEKAWINKKSISIKKGELAFAFFFPKTNHIKLYFPTRERGQFKWFNNCDNNTDIQGYWQVDPKKTKPELLILSKSMKEIMFLRERNIYSMAINGEGHSFNKDFIRHLRTYCKVIKVMYDIDETGLKQMKILNEEFGLESIIMPKFDCNIEGKLIKDPTDAWKYCNRQQVEKFIEDIKKNVKFC